MSVGVVDASRRSQGGRESQINSRSESLDQSENGSVNAKCKPLPPPPVPKKTVSLLDGQVVKASTLHRESELKIARCDSGGKDREDLATGEKRDSERHLVSRPLPPQRERHTATASVANMPNGVKQPLLPGISKRALHTVSSAPKLSQKMDEFDKRILQAQSLHMARAPDMTKIPWFHPNVSRHVAESLLLSKNIPDGTFLLRKSSQDDSTHTLSVRYKSAVKHYHVEWDGKNLVFGLGRFKDMDEFLEHFSSQPVISGESGLLVKLRYPYPVRKVKEPSDYEEALFTESLDAFGGEVVAFNLPLSSPPSVGKSLSLNTKEGFLTKLGYHRKNWKMRWFKLYRSQLQYYAECPGSNNSIQPKRTIELSDASIVSREDFPGRPYCFKLVTPTRTFFMQATSESEANEWVAILRWRLERKRQTEFS